ncbi:MAG: GyrI-like domain-containing protein [Desulfosarcinaceae bacterium]|nr:GyrI-like domain-containing protein [Desulfosarcinaceae bacterium]
MQPKLVSKAAFTIIGIALETTTEGGKNYVEIPQFWQTVMAEGGIDRIPDRVHPDTVLGVCTDFQTDGRFSYIIGAEVARTEKVPPDMVHRTIPAGEYAVFTARGRMPAAIQDAFRYIYREWLPNSSYQRAASADFEWYDGRCLDPENPEVDLYIPIAAG